MNEVTQEELEEIAGNINRGCTSGLISSEGISVSWSLKMEKWEDK